MADCYSLKADIRHPLAKTESLDFPYWFFSAGRQILAERPLVKGSN